MARINPYFEVEGKKYEIIRTRALECEYNKIREENKISEEDESLFADYLKIVNDASEIEEKYTEAKDAYFDEVLNKDKKAKYLAFKELYDEHHKEVRQFTIEHKELISNYQNKAYDNGVKILIFGLCEQCKLTEEKAVEVWGKFVEHFGNSVAKDWISAMTSELFGEDEENPFIKAQQAKMEQRYNQRKGLSKVRK